MPAEPAESDTSAETRWEATAAPRTASRRPSWWRTQSEARAERVQQMCCFEDENILRAVPSSCVLRFGGRLLSSSDGGFQSYAMSKREQRIRDFISHNWSMARAEKFLCLALHFNVTGALVLCSTAAVGVGAATYFGALPTFWCLDLRGSRLLAGVCAPAIGEAAALLGLVAWHDLAALAGQRGSPCFLDKACIHQLDAKLKEAGIKRLAAFICVSDRLLVVYSESYLRKLWTVYELASFLLMRPEGEVKVVSPVMPQCIIAGSMIVTLFWMTWNACRMEVVLAAIGRHFPPWFICGTYGLLAISFCAVMTRRWAREQQRILAAVFDFSISRAACACEDDRGLVCGNVVAMMKHLQLVPPEATEDAALHAFDSYVRERMPQAVEEAFFGEFGVPLTWAQLILAPSTSAYFADQIVPMIQQGNSAKLVIAWTAFAISYSFVILPTTGISIFLATRMFLHLGGLREVLYLMLLVVFGAVHAFGLWVLLQHLAYAADNSIGALVASLLLEAASVAIMWGAVRLSRPSGAPETEALERPAASRFEPEAAEFEI